MVYQGLWKGLFKLKEKSPTLSFKPRQGGDILAANSRQMEWQNWRNAHQKISYYAFEVLKSISLMDQRVHEIWYMCRVKLKGTRGAYCQSDGSPKLLHCTYSRILLATNAVNLTVVFNVILLMFLQNNLCYNWPICSAGWLAQTELQKLRQEVIKTAKNLAELLFDRYGQMDTWCLKKRKKRGMTNTIHLIQNTWRVQSILT